MTAMSLGIQQTLAFLLHHGELPAPRGLYLAHEGGLSVYLDTPEEVEAWGRVIGVEPSASEYQGAIQHTIFAREPFRITVIAIVPIDAQVSA